MLVYHITVGDDHTAPDNQPLSSYTKEIENSWYYKNENICLVTCGNHYVTRDIVLEKTIPKDILAKIREGSITLAIDTSTESLFEFVDRIYDNIVIKQHIPEEQILLICSSTDFIEYVQQTAKRLNKKPIKLELYNFCERWVKYNFMGDMIGDVVGNINYPNPLLKKEHKKKYINLIRRWRPQRIASIAYLESKNLLEQGYNSLLDPDSWVDYYSQIYKDFNLDPSIDVSKKLPLVLDTDDHKINLATTSQRGLVKYYQNSYFSIVNETWYENRYPKFLTEKMFKPICHKHPFIVLSTSGNLKMLRDRGYKTFDGIIDESYDSEHDDCLRFHKAMNEVERLCNLSDTEYQKFKADATPIVEHNFEVLMNKNRFIFNM